MNQKSLRVAFILNPDTWLGGKNYFRNLLIALAQLRETEIVTVLFASRGDNAPLPGPSSAEVIRTRLLDRYTPGWFFRKLLGKTLGRDLMMLRLLRRHDVSVLYHSVPLTNDSPIATIGWIPDFQHVHLPEFFSPRESLARDRLFHQLCSHCDKIVVSSENALGDLRAFAPQFADKAHVLHFVAAPAATNDVPAIAQLRQLYDINEPYFLLPNQFWIHKNHRVVVTALNLLKNQNRRVLVLATGSTLDVRQPHHFDGLMDYVKQCGVQDMFRVLGVIPFNDLAGLMHHSVALINPSKFEGWSTSVEEAKSIGKGVLLSDIPVHREQNPPYAGYFDPDDADALTALLWARVNEFEPERDIDNQRVARESLPSRQAEFARSFERIALAVRAQIAQNVGSQRCGRD